MHDELTFQLLQKGDTVGIFQLESEGMKQALRDIHPTHFLDIVAVNALYRPYQWNLSLCTLDGKQARNK